MSINIVNRFQSGIRPSAHPYLNGAWTPCTEEVDADELEVIGEIPKDLSGVYIRNTENPLHEAIGVYHPFDGDGMLHMMSFEGGRASYRNRFVRTEGFRAEQEAGRALWTGIAGNPSKSEREGWGARGRMKDSSSTDVVVFGGEALSTFYMCGEGYRLDPYTLEDHGRAAWVPPEGISAHPKVDPRTGELLFFNYGKKAPYMHYGVVGPDRKLRHMTPIPLPGPRLPHDMAFTENYSILIDLPLFWKEELLEAGIHSAAYHEDLPTRFAVVPRYGSENEIRRFEAAPTYVLHWTNAWEEGNEIVIDGYFQEDPDPAPIRMPGIDPRFGKLLANIDYHSFKPKLHRWRLNLDTGGVREERLHDELVEFGTINQHYACRPNRYVYSATAVPGMFLFAGLKKHDLETGETTSLSFGEGRVGSEAPFAPRVGGEREDDGYIVSFVTDTNEDRSECIIVDARDIAAGPVARVILPHRISSGTHVVWASHDEIRQQRAMA
ncbi:carotenoid oxygenase family protein [Parvularcula lutaonensis]|uniref:Dioxygenase n=1 Tax=Parvularcula lutaonensis TaxID=491923 RepID=A0ABV7MCH6_9PROT|nr:carotenoid oxygenase family protein [Parvularcula lutaonensis]GGY37840.1 apocarotenoid-15,15'-oxygenase [Parvularcula lutaonensis]